MEVGSLDPLCPGSEPFASSCLTPSQAVISISKLKPRASSVIAKHWQVVFKSTITTNDTLSAQSQPWHAAAPDGTSFFVHKMS